MSKKIKITESQLQILVKQKGITEDVFHINQMGEYESGEGPMPEPYEMAEIVSKQIRLHPDYFKIENNGALEEFLDALREILTINNEEDRYFPDSRQGRDLTISDVQMNEQLAETQGKLSFLIGSPISLIRILHTTGQYNKETGTMDKVQRKEEIIGTIKGIDTSEGVPMLKIVNEEGQVIASVMYHKNEFIEGESSWYYVFEPATPKDSRILELFRINFYDTSSDVQMNEQLEGDQDQRVSKSYDPKIRTFNDILKAVEQDAGIDTSIGELSSVESDDYDEYQDRHMGLYDLDEIGVQDLPVNESIENIKKSFKRFSS